MTDLVQAAIQMGMSLEDIEILRQSPNSGMVDLGLANTSMSPNPRFDPTKYSAGRPGLTGMPDGPGTQGAAYGTRMARGTMDNLAGIDAAIGLTEAARAQTAMIGKGVRGASKLIGRDAAAAGKAGRMAMQALRHPAVATALKAAPVVGTALAAGDIVFGDDRVDNKLMDTGLMVAGGALGSVVPVVGTALGAAGGKMLSDGIQFIAGGGKSRDQQELERALLALKAGQI